VSTLSADEARYVDLVAAGVPLDRNVVVAWVACESGWGVTKPGHNYLNIGPGRSYPTTDAAAADAVAVAHQANMKIGGTTAQTQLQSIIASPWDAGHYAGGCLADTYNGLGAGTVQLVGSGPLGTPCLDPTGITCGDGLVGGLGDAAGSLIDWTGLGDVLDSAVNSLGEVLLTIALGFVFTTAALGLIVLGVTRLTGKPAGEVAGTVKNVATVAAMA